jgi:hypothetical protein
MSDLTLSRYVMFDGSGQSKVLVKANTEAGAEFVAAYTDPEMGVIDSGQITVSHYEAPRLVERALAKLLTIKSVGIPVIPPLRQEFFSRVKTEPHAHIVLELVARAYADGYDKALRDAEAATQDERQFVTDLRLTKTHSDRVDEYIEHVTQTEQRAAAILATAEISRTSKGVLGL